MKIIFLILLNFISSFVLAKNLSESYLEIASQNNGDKIEKVKSVIGNATLVFIPGILGETVISSSSQPIKMTYIMGEYFHDQLSWCVDNQIKCERIILESEAAVFKNAQTLSKKLASLSGELIVFTHSKGSLEFLEVLLENTLMRKKIKAWIAIQSPFMGASGANIYLENRILKKMASWVFSFFGGDIDGISSISVSERRMFNEKRITEINNVLSEVKHIHYGSYIKSETRGESLLSLSRAQLEKNLGPNDGLVELSSTRFSSSNYIIEGGVDHLTTILDMRKIKLIPFFFDYKLKNWNFDRGRMVENLILTLE